MQDKAQAAATGREKVRRHLYALASQMRQELDLENSLAVDVPEGTVNIDLKISSTLARQLIRSLDRAQAMI